MDCGVKRKPSVYKKLLIFTNFVYGDKCAALYEVKLRICRIDGQLAVHPIRRLILEATETFYNQRTLPPIATVAACVSGSNLYLIPHDEDKPSFNDLPYLLSGFPLYEPESYPSDDESSKEYDILAPDNKISLVPCTFGLHQRKSKPVWLQIPQARKYCPIITAIGNTLFALSTLSPCFKVPKPCFESLNLDRLHHETWIALECPPFHENNSSKGIRVCYHYSSSTGFVVLEERFILVSVVQHGTTAFYSYNIHSKTWSTVQIIHENENDSTYGFVTPKYIHEDAVVVGNDIYTFYAYYKKLLVFSYAVDATTCDLSVSSFREVQGLEFHESPHCLGYEECIFERTGTVAKVDDQILCVVYTLCTASVHKQYVCVTFIELVGGGNCKALNSYRFTLLNGTVEGGQTIKFCYVMDVLEEESASDRSWKRAYCLSGSDDEAPVEIERVGGTGEREVAEVEAM